MSSAARTANPASKSKEWNSVNKFHEGAFTFTLLDSRAHFSIYRRQKDKHVMYEILSLEGETPTSTGFIFKTIRKAYDKLEDLTSFP